MPKGIRSTVKWCTKPGCANPTRARGLCNRHYLQWLASHRNEVEPYRTPTVERFFAKVEVTESCWLWTGALGEDGYARFDHEGGTLGHRYIYTLVVGAIPESLTLDHTCHNMADPPCPSGPCIHRRCVNPDHLEAVTGGVNTWRSPNATSPWTRARDALVCPNGHPRTEDNLYVWRGRRACRECRRDANRRATERRRKR